jgi:hypothetical protein
MAPLVAAPFFMPCRYLQSHSWAKGNLHPERLADNLTNRLINSIFVHWLVPFWLIT